MHIVAGAKSLENGTARTRLGRPRGSTGPQIERVKGRLALLVVLGKRNVQIAEELGVCPKTVRLWLRHPHVQREITEVEEEFHRSTERLFAGLFRSSIARLRKIIRHGEGTLALRAIELVLTAMGRLPPKGAHITLCRHGAFGDSRRQHPDAVRAST